MFLKTPIKGNHATLAELLYTFPEFCTFTLLVYSVWLSSRKSSLIGSSSRLGSCCKKVQSPQGSGLNSVIALMTLDYNSLSVFTANYKLLKGRDGDFNSLFPGPWIQCLAHSQCQQCWLNARNERVCPEINKRTRLEGLVPIDLSIFVHGIKPKHNWGEAYSSSHTHLTVGLAKDDILEMYDVIIPLLLIISNYWNINN